ncbi:MAG: HAD superfamily hydrolase (TIGR01509 family) [Gammaproteobacteria bacterium]|jgi:HAD superfamily hydrolase (TIGR01509 family)
MDGTLTNSAHDFEMMRRELGLAAEAPILEALQSMDQTVAAPLWEKLNDLEFHFAGLASVMAGAAELLESLYQRGIRPGILTRNTMPVVEQTLRACNLADFFHPDDILDRDACAPKPSPDGILKLLSNWQADASDSVMVGDFLYDLKAGRDAGVTTIHINPRGDYAWPEFTDFGISNLGQIQAVFEQ